MHFHKSFYISPNDILSPFPSQRAPFFFSPNKSYTFSLSRLVLVSNAGCVRSEWTFKSSLIYFTPFSFARPRFALSPSHPPPPFSFRLVSSILSRRFLRYLVNFQNLFYSWRAFVTFFVCHEFSLVFAWLWRMFKGRDIRIDRVQ